MCTALVRWRWIRRAKPGGWGTGKELLQELKGVMTKLGPEQQQWEKRTKGRLETRRVEMVRFGRLIGNRTEGKQGSKESFCISDLDTWMSGSAVHRKENGGRKSA